jgi:hypothetical protein
MSNRRAPQWGNTTTAYPAGTDPWSAQPTKADPGTDVFTPGQDAAAPFVNFVLNGRDIFAVQAAQMATVASPWSNYTIPGGATLKDLRATRNGEGWLTVTDNAGTYDIKFYQGNLSDANPGPQSYRANIGGNTPNLIWDFGNGSVVVMGTGGTFKRVTSGGITTPAGVTGNIAKEVASHVLAASANAIFVNENGANAFFHYSTDSGATWTTPVTPASVNTYVGDWDAATGDGAAIFVPSDGTKSKLISWNGSALSEVTISSGLVACAYDDVSGRFYVAVWDGSNTQIYAYVTAGGGTVGLVGTLANARVQDLECVAGAMVARITATPSTWVLQSDTSTLPSVLYMCAVTSDPSHWVKVDANLLDAGVAGRVRASRMGFAAFSDALISQAGHVGEASPL